MQQDLGSGIQLVRYRIFNTKLLVERWEHDKYLEKGVPKGWTLEGSGGWSDHGQGLISEVK